VLDRRVIGAFLVGCLISGIVVALLFMTLTPEEEGLTQAENQYLTLFRDANTDMLEFSLVEFENVELTLEELAPLFENKRNEFCAAIYKIENATVPPGYEDFHTEAVPLYLNIVVGMDKVIEGASENNVSKVLEGKATIVDIAGAIEAVIEQYLTT